MKIKVVEHSSGVAHWALISGTATLCKSELKPNVKACRQSARILQDSMLPPPEIVVQRCKSRAQHGIY